MKSNWKRVGVFAASMAIVGVLLVSTVAGAQGQGRSNGPGGQLTSGELSEAEIEGLTYMREEEKLARDVYLTLYEAWELPIFQNIAGSEQKHMDAIMGLLERYGLEDPTEGKEVGAFANPELQELYDQLVEMGEQSLEDALRVGAAIEEIDILDLEEHIAQADKADIQRVYENLLRGSRNHLRSFVGTLERETGESYAPQYLSQDAYDAIMSSPVERGGGGGSGGRGGRDGGRGRGGSSGVGRDGDRGQGRGKYEGENEK